MNYHLLSEFNFNGLKFGCCFFIIDSPQSETNNCASMNETEKNTDPEIQRGKADDANQNTPPPETGSGTRLSEAEQLKLIQELRIRQVELERQNEELRHTLANAKSKGMENELRLSENRFTTLFESAGDAIFIMNDKVFEICNKKTEFIFGCGKNQIIGHSPTEFSPLLQPDGSISSEKAAEKINSALAGNPQLFYWQHQRFDGTLFDAEISLNKIVINEKDCLQAIVRDISDRIQTMKALKESETKYRLLAEHMTDVVWLMDMQFNVTYQSPSSEKLRGFSLEELKNMPLDKNLTSESLQLALEVFNSEIPKIQANPDYNPLNPYELEYYCKDGSTVWLENKFSILRNDCGEPVSILGEGRDITARRKTDEALREQRWRLASIVEATRAGTWEWNIQTGETVINEHYAQMIGYTLAELSQSSHKTWESMVHPLDMIHINELLEKHFNGELSYFDCEYRIKHKDGDWIWIHDRGRVVTRDHNGKPLRMFGTHADITNRKIAENKLKESENHFRSLIAAIPDMMFVLNKDGVYLDYKAALEDLAYQTHSIIGLKNRDIMPREFSEMVEEKTRIALQTGQMQVFEYQLDLPKKGICDFEARMIANSDEQLITIVRNVTERKKAEAELILKNEQLLQANIEKEKFFSIIAHDLRGPMGAFLELTKMMVEELESFTLKELQNISVSMQSSAINIYSLLENLLEWSSIRRGVTNFKPVVSLLFTIIEESLAPVRGQAEKKKITIGFEIPEDCRVFADNNILTSIFRNLVTNAIKFSPQGGEINIVAKPIPGDWVEISIRDRGIGMDKKLIENLFRLDEQTNRRGTEGEPTTGLGLIICKEFIEKHGGKLWVESVEGEGSTFYFTLPGERKSNNQG